MLTPEQIQYFAACVAAFAAEKEMQAWLEKHQGVNLDDALKNEFGWDAKHQQFVLPVRGVKGDYLELKKFFLHDEGNWLEEADGAYEEVDLSGSINAKYYGKNIAFSGIAIGKDLSPYLVPHHICISCAERGQKKKCIGCGTADGDIDRILTIDDDKDLLVRFPNSSSQQVNGDIRRYFNIPSYNTCRLVNVEVKRKINLEEIRLTSEVNYERIDNDYVIHRCYVLGKEMRTNQAYKCYGTTWVDPKTQQGIHIIKKAKGESNNIRKWELTPEIHEQLKLFQPENQMDKFSVAAKIQEIHRDLEHNVTKIWKRDNILTACDLVMHTPLHFRFLGEYVQKGWGECAIIGDTRTGKSATVKALILHYRGGEFITSGENTTLAGLLGGLQQVAPGKWTLNWGKIVMNDRGLVVIDEADTLLEQNIMGHLTGVRSSGVAEVVKIQTQKTMARTRQIFIANPKNGSLATYNHGIDTLWDIFGKAQDISRLDFAVFVDEGAVSSEEINRRMEEQVPHVFTSEICHERLMWSWTRRSKQILWAPGCEDYILQASIEMGRQYTPEMPLVIGAEMRYTIGKMAASIAAQMFSTDDSGEVLIIHMAHAQVAVEWLCRQYNSAVSGYSDYSEQLRMDREIKNVKDLEDIIDDVDIINELLSIKQLQITDAEEIWDVNRDGARTRIAVLRRCGAIKKVSYYYKKSPAFIHWLKDAKRRLKNGEIFHSEEE